MVGVEFGTPSGPGAQYDPVRASNPNAPKSMASRVAKRCVEKGLLILTTSVYEVLRFVPPLNVCEEDMRKACRIFAEAVAEVIREGPVVWYVYDVRWRHVLRILMYHLLVLQD
jgi:4-aminobutyrate aminotransferase